MYAVPTAWQVCTSNKRVVGRRLCTSETTEYWSWQIASSYCGKARTLRNSTLLLTTSSSSRSCFLLFSSTLKDLTLFGWWGRWWKPSSHFLVLPVRAILYFRARKGNLEFTVKIKVYVFLCSGCGVGIPLMSLVVVAWLIGLENPNYPWVGTLVWGLHEF